MKFIIVFALLMASALAAPQKKNQQRGQRQADDSQNAQILKYEVLARSN
jgi:hypothetical protein